MRVDGGLFAAVYVATVAPSLCLLVLLERGRTWNEVDLLCSPDGGVNHNMGHDIDIDQGVVIAGAPGDATDGMVKSVSVSCQRV